MPIKPYRRSKNTSHLNYQRHIVYGLILGMLSTRCTAILRLVDVEHCAKLDRNNVCLIKIQAEEISAGLSLKKTNITAMTVTLYGKDQIIINADKGTYYRKAKRLVLTKHIVIQHIDPSHKKTTYKTSMATYYKRSKKLISRKKIDIYKKNQHLQANGIMINFKTKKIHLLGQVRLVIKKNYKGSSQL